MLDCCSIHLTQNKESKHIIVTSSTYVKLCKMGLIPLRYKINIILDNHWLEKTRYWTVKLGYGKLQSKLKQIKSVVTILQGTQVALLKANSTSIYLS